MRRVGVRDLRQNASKVLDRVKAGEVVEVTERGVPVAMLVPLRGDARAAWIDAGLLVPALHPEGVVAAPEFMLPVGQTTEAILDELRDDRA
jgi:prevent-host-death family protein